MNTYTVTEFEREDYEAYKQNLTNDEIINQLKYVKRGFIGDYNFTGTERDFELYKIHMALNAAIGIIENEVQHEQ